MSVCARRRVDNGSGGSCSQWIKFASPDLHFITWCFYLARKSLVAFAIFATFADFSRPFLAFFLSKSRIWWKLLFLLFLRYLIIRCFQLARKILVTFAIFWTFADFPGPFLAFSLSKSWILFTFVIIFSAWQWFFRDFLNIAKINSLQDAKK